MSTSDLVSVVIPVYNSIATLERAVNSVASMPEVGEILLVEDGSNDGSKELCARLESRYAKITVCSHPGGGNRGAAASRNLGVSLSSYDWIQFLDADDELLKRKVSDNIDVINRNPGADLVVGNYFFKNGDRTSKISAVKNVWVGLIESNLGCTCSNLWRRKKLLEVEGWSEGLSSSQEYDLMFRLLKAQSRVVFDLGFNTIVHCRPNSISTSSSRIEANAVNRIGLRMEILKYLGETDQLSLSKVVALHGFIFRNQGYISRRPAGFEVNLFYVGIYRILKLLKFG